MKPSNITDNKIPRHENTQESGFQHQNINQMHNNSNFMQNYYNGNTGSKVRTIPIFYLLI